MSKPEQKIFLAIITGKNNEKLGIITQIMCYEKDEETIISDIVSGRNPTTIIHLLTYEDSEERKEKSKPAMELISKQLQEAEKVEVEILSNDCNLEKKIKDFKVFKQVFN